MTDDLHILDYDPLSHAKHIYAWLKLREMPTSLLDDLPEVGTIAIYKELGICAAFLRKIEKHYGLIDSLISNPEALSHLRHESLDLCIESVILKSKKLKMKQVFAYSIDEGAIQRGLKAGFVSLPHQLIGLDLK